MRFHDDDFVWTVIIFIIVACCIYFFYNIGKEGNYEDEYDAWNWYVYENEYDQNYEDEYLMNKLLIQANNKNSDNECFIKWNISFESRERIYHIPWCENYHDTSIDTNYWERRFCSEQEAISSGWRKARNCP